MFVHASLQIDLVLNKLIMALAEKLTHENAGASTFTGSHCVYAFEEFMLSIAEQNKEVYVKSYCQNWLRLLSLQKFSEAQKLLDCPNSYGETWTEAKLKFAVQEYYDDTSPVTFHNEDLSRCFPEYLETGSGNLIFGFYLPSNSEITDLTVEFEFIPQGNGFYAATINDVHVL